MYSFRKAKLPCCKLVEPETIQEFCLDIVAYLSSSTLVLWHVLRRFIARAAADI